MNMRAAHAAGNCWRERFIAIARQAEAAGPRPPAPAGLRVRPGLRAGGRRFAAAAIRR